MSGAAESKITFGAELTCAELKKAVNTATRGIPGSAMVSLRGAPEDRLQSIEFYWDTSEWNEDKDGTKQ